MESRPPRESGRAGHRAKGSRHSGHQNPGGTAICCHNQRDSTMRKYESSRSWSAGCGDSVRRVTHGRHSHQRWPKFRADDFEVNASPRPERARGQAHGCKAGDNRRRVCCGPATPERYGESWITRTPMSSGATAHSLVARLHTQRYGKPRIRLLSVVRPVL